MRSASPIAALLLGLFCGVVVVPARGGDVLRQSVCTRVRVITLPSDSTRFDLPGEWIRPGTVRAVLEGDTLRAGVDYELEMTEGVFRPLRPLEAGRLIVRYEILPLAIGRVFQAPIPPDTGAVARAPIAPRPGGETTAASRARLDIRGSKTVSLEVGNAQDLTVRQSLDVSLSGEIVEGVRVRGVLSDRQTPLQAEGRTTELSDLDRVFLQVEGPGAGMMLGDFVLRGPAGLFTRYERQLDGIQLTGHRGQGSVSLAAATIPGVYRTIDLQGVEGKQGPYDLRPADAPVGAAVVAGTERVWLDGELLVRGEDRDYLIDYAGSKLTFTGRRAVTQSSRITVDYQIASQPYRRSAYGAELRWGTASRGEREVAGAAGGGGGKDTGGAGTGAGVGTGTGAGFPAGTGGGMPATHGWGLRASMLTERDDRDHAVGGPLTEREKEILQAAGDSLVAGLSSGVDCGSVGHGDYEEVAADSLADLFFRFVGDSLGSCRVRFDDVGEGHGDYRDSTLAGGRVIYRFVGLRRGRYQPGRAVPRPGERSLLALLGQWNGPAGISVEIEGAGSTDDPNTASSRDDGDRTGGALHTRLARETAPIRALGRGLGRWGLELESRDVGRRFRAPSRIDPGWIGYDWGVSSERLAGGDRRRSARLRGEPGVGLALEGSYETLSNLRDLEGERRRLAVRRSGRIFGSGELQRVDTRDRSSGSSRPGRRDVAAAAAGLRVLGAEANLGFRSEETTAGVKQEHAGSAFDEWRGSVAWILGEDRGRFEVGRALRQDHAIQANVRTNAGRARTWDARALYQPTGKLLDLRYTRRDLDGGGAARRSDLAGLLWSEERAGGRFGQQLRADLTTQEQDTRSKSIDYVGAGLGHYDSLGVYVGTGDYDVVLRPTGESRIERRLDGSWRVEFAPGRGLEAEAGGWASRALMTSQWLVLATTTARTTGSPGAFWRDLPALLAATKDGVPLALLRLRMEVSALPQARWASPQARWERERSRSNDATNLQSNRERDLLQLMLRSTPSGAWTLEEEVSRDRDVEKTRFTVGTASGASGWTSSRVRLGGWFGHRDRWTTRLGFIARWRTRVETGAGYRVLQATPGLQWIGPHKTRLDMQATRSWVAGPSGTLLGLEKAGWEARGSLALRLHANLDASAVWNLKFPDRGARQTSTRAELRAIF
jgi:hypothetical protein